MSVQASYGPPRTRRTIAVSLTVSLMVIGMLLTQLYGYEAFAAILSSVVSTNDSRAHHALAAAIVMAELLALPYLLRMYMSRLFRVLSAGMGLFLAGFWLLVALTNAHASNIGLFSDTVSLPGGLLAALWCLLLTGSVVAIIAADSRFRHVSP